MATQNSVSVPCQDQSRPAISIAGTGAGRRSRCQSFAELTRGEMDPLSSVQNACGRVTRKRSEFDPLFLSQAERLVNEVKAGVMNANNST
jgi:hypothetical protein